MVYVHNFLLTAAETHPGLGLTLRELVLNTNIEAFFVEVWRSFIIVKIFELFSNRRVLLQTWIDLLAAVEVLSIYEAITEFEEAVFCLFELLLLDFALLVIILLRCVRFNLARRCVRRDIVKVYVSLKVALLHQFNWLALGIDLVLQLEVVVLLLEIGTTSCHVLLMLVESVVERLLSILVNHTRLGFQNEFFPLLMFSFLQYLANLRVGVINRIDPHIFKLLEIKLYL